MSGNRKPLKNVIMYMAALLFCAALLRFAGAGGSEAFAEGEATLTVEQGSTAIVSVSIKSLNLDDSTAYTWYAVDSSGNESKSLTVTVIRVGSKTGTLKADATASTPLGTYQVKCWYPDLFEGKDIHIDTAFTVAVVAPASAEAEVSGLAITDSVAANGRLYVSVSIDEIEYTGAEAASMLKEEGYTLSWSDGTADYGAGYSMSIDGDTVEVVESNGGWINVTYLNGGGKTFTVTLTDASGETATASAEVPCDAETGLMVVKKVYGLNQTDAGALLGVEGLITVDGTAVILSGAEPFADADGSSGYQASYTETATVVSGGSRTFATAEDLTKAAVANYTLASTAVDGEAGSSKSVSVPAGEQVTATYCNIYEPAYYSLTVKNTVSGNIGELSKEFTFIITSSGAMQAVAGEQTAALSGDGKTATAALAHDQETAMLVPYGASVTVSEDSGEYTFSLSESAPAASELSGSGVSFTMPGQAVTFSFNNDRSAIIDTGIALPNAPYIAVLILCLAGAAFVIKRHRGTAE